MKNPPVPGRADWLKATAGYTRMHIAADLRDYDAMLQLMKRDNVDLFDTNNPGRRSVLWVAMSPKNYFSL